MHRKIQSRLSSEFSLIYNNNNNKCHWAGASIQSDLQSSAQIVLRRGGPGNRTRYVIFYSKREDTRDNRSHCNSTPISNAAELSLSVKVWWLRTLVCVSWWLRDMPGGGQEEERFRQAQQPEAMKTFVESRAPFTARVAFRKKTTMNIWYVISEMQFLLIDLIKSH